MDEMGGQRKRQEELSRQKGCKINRLASGQWTADSRLGKNDQPAKNHHVEPDHEEKGQKRAPCT